MSAADWVGTVICALTWLYALYQVGGLARETAETCAVAPVPGHPG